jgi:hypothetical protein
LVNECDRDDRGTLLQKTFSIDPVLVGIALGPWKLNDPAELIAYSVDECLYSMGRRPRLRLKKFIEMEALVSIAKPRLADGAEYNWHDNRDKQREEIFSEQ